MHRRDVLRWGAGLGLAGWAANGWARDRDDPFAGERLHADVETYSGMGEHRTGGKADNASTLWLGDRLRASGSRLQPSGFDAPLFEPDRCTLAVGEAVVEGFPAWPVVPTAGTAGPLRPAAADGDLTGAVALVVLPYRPGAAFVVRGHGSAVPDAQARGAAAIAVVTQGPTGEIIALNAHLKRFAWRVPVIQVAGREAARLTALAHTGAAARVEVAGRLTPRNRATDVLATRPALPGAPAGAVVLPPPRAAGSPARASADRASPCSSRSRTPWRAARSARSWPCARPATNWRGWAARRC